MIPDDEKDDADLEVVSPPAPILPKAPESAPDGYYGDGDVFTTDPKEVA